ncbi:MAG: hypothetical protein KatS3mg029_0145 [Saprospiraceae bacterium]|nr:MAG: hypothetical protein KatS3mg029_0145 [Saprospiraceae bacterium]
MRFEATLSIFEDSNLWKYHLEVPAEVVAKLLQTGSRRVVCTLDGKVRFQCALMPAGADRWFINVNQGIRRKLGVEAGQRLQVTVEPDDSPYGLPMPEELKELLVQDAEGNRLFHNLTPGRQRNLLYIVGSARRSETRLRRAIVCIEHLKQMKGKIDFKILNQSLRNPD